MRPGLLIGLIAAAITLSVAGGAAWHIVLWRTGWFQGPPKIAAGVPGIAGAESGPWSRRLRDEFPIGTSEIDMAETLRRQGFEVDAEARSAAYGWAAFPCVYTLTVKWRGDDRARVRSIRGGLLNACTQPSRLLPERPPRRPDGPRFERRGPPPDDGVSPSLVPPGQSA